MCNVNVISDLFKIAQREDTTLNAFFDQAKQTPRRDSLKNQHFMKGGMLYRRFQREKSNEEWTQLMVPRVFRKQILQLGHDTILAGNLGVGRTSDRICRNFYWPGIFGDITIFVSTNISVCFRAEKQDIGHV